MDFIVASEEADSLDKLRTELTKILNLKKCVSFRDHKSMRSCRDPTSSNTSRDNNDVFSVVWIIMTIHCSFLTQARVTQINTRHNK